MIAVPIVGALIGYLTNWIAVKMLFRPRHEVRIGGWKLPFTPGVIPKGQPRLARAVGEVVEKELLTTEVVEEMLLSDEMKEKLASSIEAWVSDQKEAGNTMRECMLSAIEEENWDEFLNYAKENGSEYILNKLMDRNPGKFLSEKVMEIAKQKLAESMFGMMIGGGFLDSIAGIMEEKINEYLKENGQEYLKQVIEKETDQLQEKTTGDLLILLEDTGIDLKELIPGIYEKMVREHLGSMMSAMNLSKIVEDRINSMEVEEVEVLMLKIMKKELGAIVNLGALIGLILGLVNVVILCI